MSTLTVPNIPLETTSPAQRLRRLAAAVRVHFAWFGVQKALTVQQKEAMGNAYAADTRLLTAGKKLIDTRHEAFRKLTALRHRIGQFWRSLTLPYTEPGVRLIRQADIEAFVHTMEGFRDELIQAEADLNAVYDEIKADAQGRLGRLYNTGDYPAEIRGLFFVDWEFPAIEPPSYLMRLNPELYRQEQERVAARFEEAVQLAEQAFLGELRNLVSHLTERLTTGPDGQRKVFRDSAITNLLGFFSRFRELNVRSNQDLDRLVDQAQQLVQGVTPQDLRDNTDLRSHLVGEMAQVQAALENLIVEQPRRRILRPGQMSGGGGHATAD